MQRFSSILAVTLWILTVFTTSNLGDTTITPTTLTPTPIPARDLDLLPTFETLMTETKEDCVLPCWWGLKLGKSYVVDVATFLKTTGFDRQWNLSNYSLTLEKYILLGEPIVLDFADTLYDNSGGDFRIYFGFKDDTLATLTIEFLKPNEWLSQNLDQISLAKLFSQIDEIPEIYVSSDSLDYAIILIYREHKMEISYNINLVGVYQPDTKITKQVLCLNLTQTAYIKMQLGYIDNQMARDSTTPILSRSLEETYGISTEDFVQFFKAHPDECLDVSAYKTDQ